MAVIGHSEGASMTIFWWPAVVAGVSGTLAMILAMQGLRRVGWTRQNWGSLLGTFFLPPGQEAERWGFLLHFLDGAIAGVAYALAFAAFGLEPGFWVGVALGIVHGGLGLLVFDLLRRGNPAIRQGRLPNPGAFDSVEGGRGRLAIALGFVAFGAATSTVYGFLVRQGSLAMALASLSVLMALAAVVIAWITRRERHLPTFTAASPEPREPTNKRPHGR